MFVDERGAGVAVEGGLQVTDDVVEFARDVAIVRMKARGATYREIGRFFRMSAQAVHQRHARIPANAREYYRKAKMGWLD